MGWDGMGWTGLKMGMLTKENVSATWRDYVSEKEKEKTHHDKIRILYVLPVES